MESVESFPIPKGYRFCTHLGVGPHGSTEVVCDDQGKPYVCKEIIKASIGNSAAVQCFKERLDHIKMLNIPLLVNYKEIIEDRVRIILIRDYLETKSFAEASDMFINMRESEVLDLWSDLVRTYYLLHQHQISPNYIRITNLFISDSGIRITDLLPIPADVGSTVHTPNPIEVSTLAPEFFNENASPTKFADHWSLGIILALMSTGSLPFSTRNMFTMMSQLNNAELTYVRPVSKKIDDIIRSLVKINPKERKLLREIVNMESVDALLNEQYSQTRNKSKVPTINVSGIRNKISGVASERFTSTDPINPKTTRTYMSLASLMVLNDGSRTDQIVRNRKNTLDSSTDGPPFRYRCVPSVKSCLATTRPKKL